MKKSEIEKRANVKTIIDENDKERDRSMNNGLDRETDMHVIVLKSTSDEKTNTHIKEIIDSSTDRSTVMRESIQSKGIDQLIDHDNIIENSE